MIKQGTGAVITAAGMSSRMGDFKPMLKVGTISIAQRIIATFHKAGVENITMVTGYRATELERHLADQGIIFLRNENYASSDMFESACIGLSYMMERCDRVFFTPVDIPLFTPETVKMLMASDAPLARPVCGGRTGHPILIRSDVIKTITQDRGEDGMRGALERCGVPMTDVKVTDEGILQDADTPEDYRALLEFHNKRLLRPEITVSLVREKVFLDRNISMLLHQVEETGSVRKACERMQISYSTGWNTIKRLESQIEKPLIFRSQGGSGARRSGLTVYGKELVHAFDGYSMAVRADAKDLYQEYFGSLLDL